MPTIRVHVRKDHYDLASRRNPARCVVAMAIYDAIFGKGIASRVTVHTSSTKEGCGTVWFDMDRERELPETAAILAKRFDRGEQTGDELEFDLEV